jgi:hypothetical protein
LKKTNNNLSIETVYTIFVEDPDDYYFHPRGVLFIDQESNHTLFCADVDYNFLIKVIRKFPYSDLENGLEYKGYEFEFKNISDQMIAKYGNQLSLIRQVLAELYQVSPRQYSFLEKVLQNS